MSSTLATLHKGGAFDMDALAPFRAVIVAGGILIVLFIFCCIRCYRNSKYKRSRVRKYDIVSSHELQTGLTENSDSEDDVFDVAASDRQKLVSGNS